MENILSVFDYLVRLDTHMLDLLKNHGQLIYPIIFGIIFLETGIILASFLPGDSLLFIIGTLCVGGELNTIWIALGLFLAAVAGNCMNYVFGKYLGPKFFKAGRTNFFSEERLKQAKAFYVIHGGKAIVIARFVPIVRSFAPFIAGIGSMNFVRFLIYSSAGAFLWVVLCLFIGFNFGNIPAVEDNFTIVLLAVLLFTIIPLGIGLLWKMFKKKK